MSTLSTSPSLLERVRKPSDADAWERFSQLYAPLLHAWGRQVGLDDAGARDLAQDVFVICVRTLPTFAYDQNKSFRSWLKTVAFNLWRNAARRPFQSHPADDFHNLPGESDVEAFWEVEYQRHVVARALQIMRTDFNETTWKACWEMTVQGRSAASVAAELGLSIGAAHAAKFRVLERLRAELKGLLD